MLMAQCLPDSGEGIPVSRDHKRLRVFHDAHLVTVAIYTHTRKFPNDETFGVRTQMRRAAVSVSSNIVEGNARRGSREYSRFLHIALGSACELSYLVDLAKELELAEGSEWTDVSLQCTAVVKQLQRLTERVAAFEEEEAEADGRP